MTVLEALKHWLLDCPLLAGQRLNTNYLGAEPSEFSLVEAPVTPVLYRYLDGSSTRQKAVALTGVQDYSPDLLQQLAASGFWEQVADWVEAQNETGSLPQLEDGKTAYSVEVSAAPYLFHTTPQTARYQMQLLLIYDQESDDYDEE